MSRTRAVLALVLGVCSCTDSGGAGGGSEQSPASSTSRDAQALTCPEGTAAIQEAIFAPHCAGSGCHAGDEPAQDLDLISPGLEARVVDRVGLCERPIVAAGNAAASYLITKVSHPEPSCGEPMPYGRAPLSDFQVDCLIAWIESLEAPMVAPGLAPDAGRADPRADGSAASAVDGGATGPICADDQMPCGGRCVSRVEATFDSLYAAIVEQTCVFDSCHGGLRPKEGLDMSTVDAAYASLVGVESAQQAGVLRVAPGEPADSYLIDKLRGQNLGLTPDGDPSEPMPEPPNKALCEEKIVLFETWIAAGAAR